MIGQVTFTIFLGSVSSLSLELHGSKVVTSHLLAVSKLVTIGCCMCKAGLFISQHLKMKYKSICTTDLPTKAI